MRISLVKEVTTGAPPAKPDQLNQPRDERQRREQFEALAMPLLDRLYAMALHLVREPTRADDMVQETYLRAWQNFDRFQIGTHFKAWIFQILTYLFLNERRSAQRRETTVDFGEHDIVAAPPETKAMPEASALADWEKLYPDLVDDALKRALDRLRPEQRTVFLLVTLGELSYQECADILELPIGTVMSRLFRARQQLQEELAQYAKDRGLMRGNAAPGDPEE
ncbi:MAG TPA: sigma-70 family RNA polymerase sigma factor [Planctomycetota bacterium]|jgi:RNA polymerase sigma-70 factor (ECF subfamily)